jgi:hypothetical protein
MLLCQVELFCFDVSDTELKPEKRIVSTRVQIPNLLVILSDVVIGIISRNDLSNLAVAHEVTGDIPNRLLLPRSRHAVRSISSSTSDT